MPAKRGRPHSSPAPQKSSPSDVCETRHKRSAHSLCHAPDAVRLSSSLHEERRRVPTRPSTAAAMTSTASRTVSSLRSARASTRNGTPPKTNHASSRATQDALSSTQARALVPSVAPRDCPTPPGGTVNPAAPSARSPTEDAGTACASTAASPTRGTTTPRAAAPVAVQAAQHATTSTLCPRYGQCVSTTALESLQRCYTRLKSLRSKPPQSAARPLSDAPLVPSLSGVAVRTVHSQQVRRQHIWDHIERHGLIPLAFRVVRHTDLPRALLVAVRFLSEVMTIFSLSLAAEPGDSPAGAETSLAWVSESLRTSLHRCALSFDGNNSCSAAPSCDQPAASQPSLSDRTARLRSTPVESAYPSGITARRSVPDGVDGDLCAAHTPSPAAPRCEAWAAWLRALCACLTAVTAASASHTTGRVAESKLSSPPAVPSSVLLARNVLFPHEEEEGRREMRTFISASAASPPPPPTTQQAVLEAFAPRSRTAMGPPPADVTAAPRQKCECAARGGVWDILRAPHASLTLNTVAATASQVVSSLVSLCAWLDASQDPHDATARASWPVKSLARRQAAPLRRLLLHGLETLITLDAVSVLGLQHVSLTTAMGKAKGVTRALFLRVVRDVVDWLYRALDHALLSLQEAIRHGECSAGAADTVNSAVEPLALMLRECLHDTHAFEAVLRFAQALQCRRPTQASARVPPCCLAEPRDSRGEHELLTAVTRLSATVFHASALVSVWGGASGADVCKMQCPHGHQHRAEGGDAKPEGQPWLRTALHRGLPFLIESTARGVDVLTSYLDIVAVAAADTPDMATITVRHAVGMAPPSETAPGATPQPLGRQPVRPQTRGWQVAPALPSWLHTSSSEAREGVSTPRSNHWTGSDDSSRGDSSLQTTPPPQRQRAITVAQRTAQGHASSPPSAQAEVSPSRPQSSSSPPPTQLVSLLPCSRHEREDDAHGSLSVSSSAPLPPVPVSTRHGVLLGGLPRDPSSPGSVSSPRSPSRAPSTPTSSWPSSPMTASSLTQLEPQVEEAARARLPTFPLSSFSFPREAMTCVTGSRARPLDGEGRRQPSLSATASRHCRQSRAQRSSHADMPENRAHWQHPLRQLCAVTSMIDDLVDELVSDTPAAGPAGPPNSSSGGSPSQLLRWLLSALRAAHWVERMWTVQRQLNVAAETCALMDEANRRSPASARLRMAEVLARGPATPAERVVSRTCASSLAVPSTAFALADSSASFACTEVGDLTVLAVSVEASWMHLLWRLTQHDPCLAYAHCFGANPSTAPFTDGGPPERVTAAAVAPLSPALCCRELWEASVSVARAERAAQPRSSPARSSLSMSSAHRLDSFLSQLLQRLLQVLVAVQEEAHHDADAKAAAEASRAPWLCSPTFTLSDPQLLVLCDVFSGHMKTTTDPLPRWILRALLHPGTRGLTSDSPRGVPLRDRPPPPLRHVLADLLLMDASFEENELAALATPAAYQLRSATSSASLPTRAYVDEESARVALQVEALRALQPPARSPDAHDEAHGSSVDRLPTASAAPVGESHYLHPNAEGHTNLESLARELGILDFCKTVLSCTSDVAPMSLRMPGSGGGRVEPPPRPTMTHPIFALRHQVTVLLEKLHVPTDLGTPPSPHRELKRGHSTETGAAPRAYALDQSPTHTTDDDDMESAHTIVALFTPERLGEGGKVQPPHTTSARGASPVQILQSAADSPCCAPPIPAAGAGTTTTATSAVARSPSAVAALAMPQASLPLTDLEASAIWMSASELDPDEAVSPDGGSGEPSPVVVTPTAQVPSAVPAVAVTSSACRRPAPALCGGQLELSAVVAHAPFRVEYGLLSPVHSPPRSPTAAASSPSSWVAATGASSLAASRSPSPTAWTIDEGVPAAASAASLNSTDVAAMDVEVGDGMYSLLLDVDAPITASSASISSGALVHAHHFLGGRVTSTASTGAASVSRSLGDVLPPAVWRVYPLCDDGDASNEGSETAGDGLDAVPTLDAHRHVHQLHHCLCALEQRVHLVRAVLMWLQSAVTSANFRAELLLRRDWAFLFLRVCKFVNLAMAHVASGTPPKTHADSLRDYHEAVSLEALLRPLRASPCDRERATFRNFDRIVEELLVLGLNGIAHMMDSTMLPEPPLSGSYSEEHEDKGEGMGYLAGTSAGLKEPSASRTFTADGSLHPSPASSRLVVITTTYYPTERDEAGLSTPPTPSSLIDASAPTEQQAAPAEAPRLPARSVPDFVHRVAHASQPLDVVSPRMRPIAVERDVPSRSAAPVAAAVVGEGVRQNGPRRRRGTVRRPPRRPSTSRASQREELIRTLGTIETFLLSAVQREVDAAAVTRFTQWWQQRRSGQDARRLGRETDTSRAGYSVPAIDDNTYFTVLDQLQVLTHDLKLGDASSSL